ncbi:MAG: hypothetical protein VCB78_13370 [Myxococcota bacterium]|jgi:hypothetical protein
MSEFDAVPRILFKTRSNTELGAGGVALGEDGSIMFEGVLKQVTESMLTSYPRNLLGCWTTNRASLRYTREEIADRKVRDFASGEALDLDAVLALAG